MTVTRLQTHVTTFQPRRPPTILTLMGRMLESIVSAVQCSVRGADDSCQPSGYTAIL